MHYFISCMTYWINKWWQKQQSSHIDPMSHSLVLHSVDKVIIDYWLRHKYITWHNSCDARTQKRNIKLVRYRFHSQPYSRPVEIKRISYRRAANLPKRFYFFKEFNAPPTHIHRPPKVWHQLEHRRHARVLIPNLEFLLPMIITKWDYSVFISS